MISGVEKSTTSISFSRISLDLLSPVIEKTYSLYNPELGYLCASGKDDIYKRPFCRDTMMSVWHQLNAHELNPTISIEKVYPAVAFILLHTPETDIPDAGIYRGKPPHEMGTLDQGFPKNFGYVNESGFGICCDNSDGADRTLLNIFRLEEIFPGKLQEIINQLAIKLGITSHNIDYYIEMITEWAVANTREFQGSAFIGAAYDPKRDNKKHGGLNKQLWRDSEYSVTKADGSDLVHPIYPAEEQALRWSALRQASVRLSGVNPELAYEAFEAAQITRQNFNRRFIYRYEDQDNETTRSGIFIASAVDKNGYQVRDVTCDEITLLSHKVGAEYFISDPYLRKEIILRSYQRLFDNRGGFRTIDRLNHPQNIYHGPTSIWPHRQADIVYAIDTEAERVKEEDPFWNAECNSLARNIAIAALKPMVYYNNPIELVLLTDTGYDIFRTYCEEFDRYQESSRVQAFSGFSALYLTEYIKAKHQVNEIDLVSNILQPILI